MAADPFARHPELRGCITDPMTSAMRSLDLAALEARLTALGLPVGWWHSDAEREASRAEAMEGRCGRDLWVFAYGSLMWDPALRFAEVRRAHVPTHARRFILKDIYGGRGTRAAPGLMAALDDGPGCDGLLFRIAAGEVETETEVLWRREKMAPAYRPVFVPAIMDDAQVEALAFVADHDAELIDARVTRTEQVRYLATGTGFLGSSLDYLRKVCAQCAVLGIPDPDLCALLAEAEALAAAQV